ncbi:MAG: hypothetical protein ABIK89_24315 [Planctomycetota bacterium]
MTEIDREHLGSDLKEYYGRLGTAGMWMELRGVSLERAVIEVARELGFLDEPTANWLLREIGEDTPPPRGAAHPVWNRETGRLCWGKKVIRRVRIMKHPSSVQRILDAFQAAGWPSRIADPLSMGEKNASPISSKKRANAVRQVVRYLNKGLELIRFHVQEGGGAITWTRI